MEKELVCYSAACRATTTLERASWDYGHWYCGKCRATYVAPVQPVDRWTRVFVSPMTDNAYPVSIDGAALASENREKEIITDGLIGAYGIIAGYNPWSGKRVSETRMMSYQSGRCC